MARSPEKVEPEDIGFEVFEHRVLGSVVPGKTMVFDGETERRLGVLEAAYLLIGRAQENADGGDSTYEFTIPAKYNGSDMPLQVRVEISTSLLANLD